MTVLCAWAAASSSTTSSSAPCATTASMASPAAGGRSLWCWGRNDWTFGVDTESEDERALAVDEWASCFSWRLDRSAIPELVRENTGHLKPVRSSMGRPGGGARRTRRNRCLNGWRIRNLGLDAPAGKTVVDVVTVTGLKFPETLVARGNLSSWQGVEMLVGV